MARHDQADRKHRNQQEETATAGAAATGLGWPIVVASDKVEIEERAHRVARIERIMMVVRHVRNRERAPRSVIITAIQPASYHAQEHA
jgi:hypothetical protein